MSLTDPAAKTVTPEASTSVHRTIDDAASPGLTSALDRIGFGRVQAALILLLMAGLFFDSLEQNSTGAMGTLLKESFGIGNAELTMINTATVLGGLAGRLIGGYIADRWGRRAALSLNLLVYTLGGLVSAAAVNYEMLLASRFVVGIGLGGEFTVGLAILAEIVATRHRGTLLAELHDVAPPSPATLTLSPSRTKAPPPSATRAPTGGPCTSCT